MIVQCRIKRPAALGLVVELRGAGAFIRNKTAHASVRVWEGHMVAGASVTLQLVLEDGTIILECSAVVTDIIGKDKPEGVRGYGFKMDAAGRAALRQVLVVAGDETQQRPVARRDWNTDTALRPAGRKR